MHLVIVLAMCHVAFPRLSTTSYTGIPGCDSPILDSNTKYLLIGNNYDQINTHVSFLADAVFYARTSRRVLVEPTYRNARLVDPILANCRSVGGGAKLIADAVGAKENKSNKSDTLQPIMRLSDVLDLRLHCKVVSIVDLCTFVRAMDIRAMDMRVASAFARSNFVAVVDGDLDNRGMEGIATSTQKAVRFWNTGPLAHTPVVMLRHFKRSNANPVQGLIRLRPSPGALASTRSREFMPAFGISERLRAYAQALTIAAVGGQPFMCVQWRSEASAASARDILDTNCSTDILFRARRASEILRETSRTPNEISIKVVLATDLIPGNSGTYKRPPSASRALARIELGLPIHQDLMNALRAITDNTERSIVHQLVCANATTMISCDHKAPLCGEHAHGRGMCQKCTRTLSSFTKTLKILRKDLVADHCPKFGLQPTMLCTW